MSEKTKTNASTRVITPVGILSYPHNDVPVQELNDDGTPKGKPKYSDVIVFESTTNLDALKAAVLAAAEGRWPGKVQAMIADSRQSVTNGGPLKFRLPFRSDAKDGYPVGAVFINARSEAKPQCVYAWPDPATGKPAIIPDANIREQLYAGAKVRLSLTAFAYDRNGNKGVSFALNNVQKIGEGERLDNRKAAVDEFEIDLSAVPADLSALGIG